MTGEQKRQEEQKREDERRRLEDERRRREQQAADERAGREARRQEQSQTQGGGADPRGRGSTAGDRSEGTAQTLSRGSGFTESQEKTIKAAQERGVPIALAGLKRESGGGREAGSPPPGEKPEPGQDSPAVAQLKDKMGGMQDKIQDHIKAHGQTQEPGHER